MQKKLSKSGIDVHDHSAKSAVDGARLTGKDRSLEDVRRRILANAEHKAAELYTACMCLSLPSGGGIISR